MNLYGNLDARIIFFVAGILLTILSGEGIHSASGFIQALSDEDMIAVVCTVTGYYYLLSRKEGYKKLQKKAAHYIMRLGPSAIPLTVLVTFGVNILLPSALGCAVVMGWILIPLLISARIHASLAACAVLAGTFGSVLNAQSVHAVLIARASKVNVSTVVHGYQLQVGLGLLIVAASLWLWARHIQVKQQDESEQEFADVEQTHVYLPVFLLLLPIILIAVCGFNLVFTMIVCIFGVLLLYRETLTNSSTLLFTGMSDGFSKAVLGIVAATVLVHGLEAVNFIGLMSETLSGFLPPRSQAVVIPFVTAFFTGSGDQATMMFNSSIVLRDLPVLHLGSLAYIAGALGRALSPVAGSMIVCAYIADVNLWELMKYNAVGLLLTLSMFMLF